VAIGLKLEAGESGVVADGWGHGRFVGWDDAACIVGWVERSAPSRSRNNGVSLRETYPTRA
jgi:hypothetical protein